jgi:hypothetical protein
MKSATSIVAAALVAARSAKAIGVLLEVSLKDCAG